MLITLRLQGFLPLHPERWRNAMDGIFPTRILL